MSSAPRHRHTIPLARGAIEQSVQDVIVQQARNRISRHADVPPNLSSAPVSTSIPHKKEIGREEAFSEEQIIGFLHEAEAGMPVKDLCRKHDFSEASYYLWRSKFGGMSVPRPSG